MKVLFSGQKLVFVSTFSVTETESGGKKISK